MATKTWNIVHSQQCGSTKNSRLEFIEPFHSNSKSSESFSIIVYWKSSYMRTRILLVFLSVRRGWQLERLNLFMINQYFWIKKTICIIGFSLQHHFRTHFFKVVLFFSGFYYVENNIQVDALVRKIQKSKIKPLNHLYNIYNTCIYNN